MEVAKFLSKENEHICSYASKFEGYQRFFKETLSGDVIIAMFLSNVKKALRVHTITIKRAKPSWGDFL